MNIVRRGWYKLTGRVPPGAPQRMDVGKLIRHEKALLRLGYWREETLVVSMPAGRVCGIAAHNGKNLWHPDFTKEVCVVAPIGTNTIIVRAVPDHIRIWERLIRDADTGQLK